MGILDGKYEMSPNKLALTIVTGIIGVLFFANLLPTFASTLQNMVDNIFGGTIFGAIFSNGLLVGGLLAILVVRFLIREFKLSGTP